MRQLKINLLDLEQAFDLSFPETHYYMDLETGEVLMVSDEDRYALEQVLEEANDEKSIEDIVAQSDLPEWQQPGILAAYRVQEGCGPKIVPVPVQDSREDFKVMEDFIPTVGKLGLREELEHALRGKSPFRRFRDAVEAEFHHREKWLEFKQTRLRQRMTDWLHSLDIEPVDISPPPEVATPPRPPVRNHLLKGVLAFVKAASTLAGVQRIALIGSLSTAEPSPKDVDLLVTVTDEMELAALARLGRKLSGHAQQMGRGGEVFLADSRGKYIGRTCPWKECRPGIRMSCDADHCGRRHYLHDDLRSITLKAEVVNAPPIVLWPSVLARVTAPPDVEELLLIPLRQLHLFTGRLQ